jgi:hypothetical protein
LRYSCFEVPKGREEERKRIIGEVLQLLGYFNKIAQLIRNKIKRGLLSLFVNVWATEKGVSQIPHHHGRCKSQTFTWDNQNQAIHRTDFIREKE